MNTIILKEETKVGNNFSYYLTKVSKEDADKLEKLISEGDKEITNGELRKLVKNDKAILLAAGDGMKLRSHKIEPILGRISNGDLRCYDIPLEQQESSSHLACVCTETKTCWQSALRKVGYKEIIGLNTPAYFEAPCLIWKTVN